MSACGSGGGEGTVPQSEVIDDSFSVDRLYGRWTEENGERVLILTSQMIKLSKGSSSTSSSSPNIKTDKDTLYVSLSNLKDMKIEEKEDGTLRIYNDSAAFIQKENWSEAGIDRSAGPVDIAMNEDISTDFVQIRFEEEDIVNEIKVSSTTGGGSGSGGHITITQIIEKEESGKKFVYLKGTIKNIAAYPVEADKIKSKLVINDKYELEGDVDVVTEGADRIHNLDPLNTAMIYLHTGIDAGVVSDISKLDWYIGFEECFSGNDRGDPNGSKYYYKILVK